MACGLFYQIQFCSQIKDTGHTFSQPISRVVLLMGKKTFVRMWVRGGPFTQMQNVSNCHLA